MIDEFQNVAVARFNYVAAAEENPWLQQLDVEASRGICGCCLEDRQIGQCMTVVAAWFRSEAFDDVTVLTLLIVPV